LRLTSLSARYTGFMEVVHDAKSVDTVERKAWLHILPVLLGQV
jgi:hypothetical protein